MQTITGFNYGDDKPGVRTFKNEAKTLYDTEGINFEEQVKKYPSPPLSPSSSFPTFNSTKL